MKNFLKGERFQSIVAGAKDALGTAKKVVGEVAVVAKDVIVEKASEMGEAGFQELTKRYKAQLDPGDWTAETLALHFTHLSEREDRGLSFMLDTLAKKELSNLKTTGQEALGTAKEVLSALTPSKDDE